jgi:hypothetical protein
VGRSEKRPRGETLEVTYRLEVRPDAIIDIEEAIDWYDQRELGLGAY